jgi:CTP:molybdopterin cytidylyltransferase MocA
VRISCIVLAAGESTRMGSPKPLLPFDGQTCLSLVTQACRDSRADETILVLGADADRVRRALGGELPGALTIAMNENFQRGQTSSVKTGLEAASPHSDAWMILPVDLPLVRREDLDAVIARCEARPRGRTLFIATHEGRRGHPLLLTTPHRGPVLELADEEPLSSYLRLHEGEVDQVPVDNPGLLLPMNTPAEYQAVLGLWRARGNGPAGPS